MVEEKIEIGALYDSLVAEGREVHQLGDYSIIEAYDLQIKTHGNKYVCVNFVSAHKTTKDIIELTVRADSLERSIKVTTDHICMVYNADHFFENTNAKNLHVGQIVSVYDEEHDYELVGEIVRIDNRGPTTETVYDIEVADDEHCFYGNDILVHNSQFINLTCVTDWMKKTYGLKDNIRDWAQKDRNLLWKTVNDFVEEKVNPFVRGLVHDYCYTNEQNVLTYELEYMSDVMLAESKKHYATHKIFDEGDPVKKTKFSGIELKKAQLPKEMKVFLKDFYDGAIEKDWTQKDYDDYVFSLYEKFNKFGVDEISFWKGYNTAREAAGFLQMKTGATGISKCCTYYNQLIEKMGLTKKYDTIQVGDKVRMLYLDENNPYRINCIAYKPDQWPNEFDSLFKPDYRTMFDKVILDSLKRYRVACGFSNTDPSKQVELDIFTL